MDWDFYKKKRMVAAGLCTAVVLLAGGVFFLLGGSGGTTTAASGAAETTEYESTVMVPEITTEMTLAAANKVTPDTEEEPSETGPEAVKDETGETEPESIPQQTTPVVTRPAETEAARVRNPEEATPPASEVAAVPVENPDENGACQPEQGQPTAEQPQGGDTNSDGMVYFPGFGYVENSGSVAGETIDTDGDWDKQLGTMD